MKRQMEAVVVKGQWAGINGQAGFVRCLVARYHPLWDAPLRPSSEFGPALSEIGPYKRSSRQNTPDHLHRLCIAKSSEGLVGGILDKGASVPLTEAKSYLAKRCIFDINAKRMNYFLTRPINTGNGKYQPINWHPLSILGTKDQNIKYI